jgi:hypothetical protein
MYLIWMVLCLVCTLLVYLYVPETMRLPMEEVAALFGDTVVVHLTADGRHVLEEVEEKTMKDDTREVYVE